jgi:hypothetical protein
MPLRITGRKLGLYLIRAASTAIIIGALWWVTYAVREHYRMQHRCNCVLAWEIVPFIVGGLALLFAFGILSKTVTEGAAAIVLPFADLVVRRFGRRDVDPVAVITPPGMDPNLAHPTVDPNADPPPGAIPPPALIIDGQLVPRVDPGNV